MGKSLSDRLRTIAREVTEPVTDLGRHLFYPVEDTRNKDVSVPSRLRLGGAEHTDGHFLTDSNHVFAIGKMPRKNNGQDLYSLELLRTGIEYLSLHSDPSTRAQLMLVGKLSRICNGLEDKPIFDLEEQKAIVLKEAKAVRGDDKWIQVYGIEEQYPDLFEHISRSSDAGTGMICPEACFGGDVTIDSDVLGFSRLVYQFCKKDPNVRSLVRSVIPNDLTSQEESTPEDIQPYECYPIIEFATRFFEVYRGRNFHIGAERQAEYHRVFLQLSEKFCSSGHPTFGFLKEAKFQGINIKKDNYHARKFAQSRLRVRSALLTAAGLTMVGAIGGLAHQNLKEEQAHRAEIEVYQSEVRARLAQEASIRSAFETAAKDQLAGERCLIDGKFSTPIDVKLLNEHANAVSKTIADLFEIPKHLIDPVKGIIVNGFLEDPDTYCAVLEYNQNSLDSVYQFVYSHPLFFEKIGYPSRYVYPSLKRETLFNTLQADDSPVDATAAYKRVGTYSELPRYVFTHDIYEKDGIYWVALAQDPSRLKPATEFSTGIINQRARQEVAISQYMARKTNGVDNFSNAKANTKDNNSHGDLLYPLSPHWSTAFYDYETGKNYTVNLGCYEVPKIDGCRYFLVAKEQAEPLSLEVGKEVVDRMDEITSWR